MRFASDAALHCANAARAERDGAVDVGGGRERDPPGDLAGRGIVDVAEALGGGVGGAVDPVADGLQVWWERAS